MFLEEYGGTKMALKIWMVPEHKKSKLWQEPVVFVDGSKYHYQGGVTKNLTKKYDPHLGYNHRKKQTYKHFIKGSTFKYWKEDSCQNTNCASSSVLLA